MSAPEARPPRDQPLLSAAAVAATLLVLPLLAVAGNFHWLMVPGVGLAAALVAAGRDSLHALAALMLVALLWLVADPAPLSPWSLVLAVLMLTAHSAVALRSTVPPGATLDSAITLRWVWRGLAVIGLAVLVYLGGLAVHHLRRADSEVVVVVALVLLGGLVLLLRNETVQGAVRPSAGVPRDVPPSRDTAQHRQRDPLGRRHRM